MLKIKHLVIVLFLVISSLIPVPKAYAASIASQTVGYSNQLPVWQAIQELGDNLSGNLKNFTFRVQLSIPNNQQFDFTAQNTKIYDKTTNTLSATGCIPTGANPTDKLRGLTFTTENIPTGYEDVTLDFSCSNYTFITGHKYLILISNANMCVACIKFAGATYNSGQVDLFTGGGARYANGNRFDTSHNSGSCNPITYIWNSQTLTPSTGCNIWTTPQDDLYFVLNNDNPDKTPLIFIPGIGGSELKVAEDTIWNEDNGHGGIYNHAYHNDDLIWLNEQEAGAPGNDDFFDILRMKSDGATSEAQVQLTGNVLARAYQEAVNFFINNGYELNKNLFVFPYDWRKDLAFTKALLDQKVNQVKNQTGTAKVDMIAHSMGGLVARNYISDANKAQNVRKLLTLGTPHLGSVQTLKQLNYGECLSPIPISTGPVCLGVSPSEIKDVLQNMIGAYELVASQAYFTFYSNNRKYPSPYKTENGELSYPQMKEFLNHNYRNTALFIPSENFHTLDNLLSANSVVETTIIVGSGRPTIGQIVDEKKRDFFGKEFIHRDIVNINGDETVPLFSASLSDPERNISLLGNAKVFYTNQEHGELVSSGPALNLVKNILEGSNQLPSGVSDQPYKLQNGLLFSVHSPVNIHVYDELGNHTGPKENGDYEANIPNSSYDTLDDAKFIYLPNYGQYNISFEGIGEGSFDFKIRKYNDDLVSETVLYKDVPVSEATRGHTTYDSSSTNSPILEIDNNGDGTTDSSVYSFSDLIGEDVNDSTTPITTISLSGDLGNDNWYKGDIEVTLNASDGLNGSGIATVEYAIDDSQVIQTYNHSFNISQEGTRKIKFRGTDRAGNVEESKEVELKIDKTSPSISISSPTNNGVYILNQPIQVVYSCKDENSELDTCNGTQVNNGLLDTSTVGEKTITVTSKDKAGNVDAKQIIYYVQYSKEKCLDNLSQTIMQPINADGTSVFKQGSTVPAKFRVCDYAGVSINSSEVVKSFKLIKSAAGTVVLNINESVSSTTPEFTFRWDSTNKQWIFNMGTKNLTTGKTYYYEVTLNDMSKVLFSFGLK